MASESVTTWEPGMDLPYAVSLGARGMLAILLHAEWVAPDRSGRPLLLPPAVLAIDRLRAVFATASEITPGFILGLREAMGLTQEQFGRKLGVTKMTVSRWERGGMRPTASTAAAIRGLQTRVAFEGVRIDGENRDGSPERHASRDARRRRTDARPGAAA